VTTLHTILKEPKADQRRVIEELIALSTRLVVMTDRGRQTLHEIYQAKLSKIDLIPHGILDVAFEDPAYFKDQFQVEGRTVLLTFGLLSPNKGIEYVLNALPEVLAEFPDVVYIVLGATHPNELRRYGEAYRLGLEILATKNKLEKHVIFCNQFVDPENLTEFMGAADLYITPYLNAAQITSGTLSFAFGSGKAVVSTPYWHAADLLADGRGALVPFADSHAMAEQILGLLRDDTRRNAMRTNAYRLGREMIWSNVAQIYMHSFELARLEAAPAGRAPRCRGPPAPPQSPQRGSAGSAGGHQRPGRLGKDLPAAGLAAGRYGIAHRVGVGGSRRQRPSAFLGARHRQRGRCVAGLWRGCLAGADGSGCQQHRHRAAHARQRAGGSARAGDAGTR